MECPTFSRNLVVGLGIGLGVGVASIVSILLLSRLVVSAPAD